MNIAQGWKQVDYYTGKVSHLVKVISYALVILGVLLQAPTLIQFGVGIVGLTLLQYLLQSMVIARHVRKQELKKAKSFKFPWWLPYVGLIPFSCKVILTGLALVNLLEVTA